jgi:hypothetical protein
LYKIINGLTVTFWRGECRTVLSYRQLNELVTDGPDFKVHDGPLVKGFVAGGLYLIISILYFIKYVLIIMHATVNVYMYCNAKVFLWGVVIVI